VPGMSVAHPCHVREHRQRKANERSMEKQAGVVCGWDQKGFSRLSRVSDRDFRRSRPTAYALAWVLLSALAAQACAGSSPSDEDKAGETPVGVGGSAPEATDEPVSGATEEPPQEGDDVLMPTAVRGLVQDSDPIDVARTGCCSRASDVAPSAGCPVGTGETVRGVLEREGDTVELGGTPATVGVPFRATAPSQLAKAVTVQLMETEIPPPAGVIDLSPVYWIASESTVPALAVNVNITSNASELYPDVVGVYYSADGETYARLPDSYLNAGFVQGVVPGGGFVLAGSAPEGLVCR